MSDSNLQITVEGERALLVIVGNASRAEAVTLKTFTQKRSSKGIRHFTLDLGACVSMDEPFLGLLISLGLQLKAQNGRGEIRNATRLIEARFYNLGVDRLFELSSS